MGKHDFLTPKAIANRIKSKGLQKLRWYCQMCQKQCRDENGFKCHTMSESHQRQLLLVADNPHKYLDAFSEEFLKIFMDLVKRRYGTKRVHCNQVYQEYISDKQHIHMNSTKWESLTGFVKWLGRKGYCTVDQTEKGWFITYIDRDPETIQRQEQLAKKKKMDLDDEERAAKYIQEQVERAEESGASCDATYTELQRDNEEEKVAFSLATKLVDSSKKDSPNNGTPAGPDSKTLDKVFAMPNPLLGTSKVKKETGMPLTKDKDRKRKSALDLIMEEEEKKKAKVNRKDYWLHEGIVVKVITKKLGEKYHKKKAFIKEVKDYYTAVIKMLNSGDKLKVDQAHLETVLPAQGKQVLVVNGAYRGHTATLETIDEKQFSATIKIDAGPTKGRLVEGVQYEDICKIHSA